MHYIDNYFLADIRLALFGSSVNNFGFQGSNRGRSDMDICMRLKPDEVPEGFDSGSEIVKVSRVLDRNPLYQKVGILLLCQVGCAVLKFLH